jgi:hypothetical protein
MAPACAWELRSDLAKYKLKLEVPLKTWRRRSLRTFGFAAFLFLATGLLGQTAPPTPAQSEQATVTEEHKVTPQEAKELFRSIDEILKFSSEDTGLPIKHKVKRKLISRDEVVAYLTKHMSDDEDAQRLRRSELVLKKFGLLPREFDLQKFLVALLREQVAGFYEPKSKTVNLLDWVDAEQQKPVLAHELTHALQDQSFGLEKWMKDQDLTTKKDPTATDIEADEISTARQAVVEGQAMVTLIDYTLAPMNKSLLNSPEVAEALKQGMLVGTADSIEFHNAPIFLKEALTFPYRYGLDFEAALMKVSKQKAFINVFKDPPKTTRQIMEPETYLSGERIEPMKLPDFAAVFKDYERFDIGAMGEFDVAILVDQYAGVEASHRMYPHWRGGYYYAAKRKDDQNAPLGLFYASRWSNSENAQKFAAIYAQSLTKRHSRAREAVADDIKPVELEKIESLPGTHTFLTEEGPVVISTSGDTVLVSESLDPKVTEDLERLLLPPKSN